jgi:hypothetical protein
MLCCTYVSRPVAGSNAATRTVSVPLSPGDSLDGPDGELVGAPDGGGVTLGGGVSPLVEGAAEAVDVRGLVGPGMDDRAALEGTVGRDRGSGRADRFAADGAADDDDDGAGTAVPCAPAVQATVVARRRWWQAAPRPARRGPPGGSRSSSADAHLLLVSHLLIRPTFPDCRRWPRTDHPPGSSRGTLES